MKFQKITTYLWFDNQELEAVEFYCLISPNSKVLSKNQKIVEFSLEVIDF